MPHHTIVVDALLICNRIPFERGACRTGSAHRRHSTFPKAAQGRQSFFVFSGMLRLSFIDVNKNTCCVNVVVQTLRETKEPSKKFEEARRRGLNKARRCGDNAPMDNHANDSKAGEPSLKFRKKQMQERAWAERTAARRAQAEASALEAQVSDEAACVNADQRIIQRTSMP